MRHFYSTWTLTLFRSQKFPKNQQFLWKWHSRWNRKLSRSRPRFARPRRQIEVEINRRRNNQRRNVLTHARVNFSQSETSSLLRGGKLNFELLLRGGGNRKDPKKVISNFWCISYNSFELQYLILLSLDFLLFNTANFFQLYKIHFLHFGCIRPQFQFRLFENNYLSSAVWIVTHVRYNPLLV